MFNVFGVLVMAVLGGWVLGGGDRPDLVMYSRYVSTRSLLPWLTLSLASVSLPNTSPMDVGFFSRATYRMGAYVHGWVFRLASRTIRALPIDGS